MFWCKVTRAFTQAVTDCFGALVHAGCGLAYPSLRYQQEKNAKNE